MHGEQLDETIWHPVVLAFLRDIKAHPDDDTPRLILADWLEEYGDAVRAARGEFLRLQCHSADTLNRERQAELLAWFERPWLGPLTPLARYWAWRRGLLHVEMAANTLASSTGSIPPEAFAWVEGVTIRGLRADLVPNLTAAPWLEWLNMLDLNHNPIGDSGVAALALSTNLPYLRTLWLRGNDIGPTGTAALASSAVLGRLESLSLSDNRIGEAGARALLNSPLLDHLTFLNLEGNRLDGPVLTALERAEREHPGLWLHLGPSGRH